MVSVDVSGDSSTGTACTISTYGAHVKLIKMGTPSAQNDQGWAGARYGCEHVFRPPTTTAPDTEFGLSVCMRCDERRWERVEEQIEAATTGAATPSPWRRGLRKLRTGVRFALLGAS